MKLSSKNLDELDEIYRRFLRDRCLRDPGDDPHAMLVEYLRSLQARDLAGMSQHHASLLQWLEAGGFAPDTTKAIHGIFDLG